MQYFVHTIILFTLNLIKHIRTMKSLLLICITFGIAFTTLFAQNAAYGIEIPEFNTLYYGYSNIVRPVAAPSKGATIHLTGTNCIITKQIDGTYTIIPEKGREVTLTILSVRREKTDTLYKKSYAVKRMPDPEIFWGAVADGGRIDIYERCLFSRYAESSHLSASFTVKEWQLIIGNDTVSGTGNKLKHVNGVLRKVNSPSEAQIIALVTGPDHITREIKGKWNVPMWVEYNNRIGYNNYSYKCPVHSAANRTVYKNPADRKGAYETIQLNDDSTYSYTLSLAGSSTWNEYEDTGNYIQQGNSIVLRSSDTTSFNAAIEMELLLADQDQLHGYFENDVFCNGSDTFLIFIHNKNPNTYRNIREEDE